MASYKLSSLWAVFLAAVLGVAACGELKSEDEDTGDTGKDSSGDTSTDGDTDTDTDGDADTDTDTDTDVDTDADGDGDTDGDTDTDTDADGGDVPDAAVDGGETGDTDSESSLDCFYDGEIHSATATEREWGGDSGNCGYAVDYLPTYYATVSSERYADSAACGRCVSIRNPANDATLEAMAVDQCPAGSEASCGKAVDDLSLNAAAKAALDITDDSAAVEWYFVPCTFEGFDKIRFHFKNDANPDWFAIQVLNHRNPLKKLEVRVDGEWKDAPRQNWNYWVIENCCGEGPLDIRVTDIFDNAITANNVPFSPGQTVDGPKQFPACGDTADTDPTGPDTDTSNDPPLEAGQDYTLRVSDAPVIDGLPNEPLWHFDTKVEKTVSGTTENTASFDAVWDDDYLYVAAKVTDNTLCVGVETNSWWYDSVEIYLDPDNSKTSCDTADENAACYDDKDVQMVVKYTDDKSWHQFGDNTKNTGLAYEAQGNVGEGGYTIEARIPWSGLGFVPTPGAVFGFDIGINDNDLTDCAGVNDGSRTGELRWQGTDMNYRTTAGFGELVIFSRRAN